jgi:hypothetical protein
MHGRQEAHQKKMTLPMEPSHHQKIIELLDKSFLLDYEPGPVSKTKQAHEIAKEIQGIPVDELSEDDREVLGRVKKKVWDILNA